MPYWVLFVRWAAEENWTVEYGDWDLDTVRDEIESMKSELYQVTIVGCSGEQKEIDQLLRLYNQFLNAKREEGEEVDYGKEDRGG